MKALLKPVLAAGFVLASAAALTAAPAAAQVVKGIGVIDPGTIVAASAAFKTAESQRPTTYAAYYQQARDRQAQLEAQLEPLAKKFDTDRQAPNPNTEDLRKQLATIQQLDQQGENDLKQILQPVALSQAYVKEQLEDVLPKAIDNAAAKKNITLILNGATSQILIRDNSYDMNAAVTTELDVLLPTAQLSPPPGWLPRELRERAAAQAAAQAAANGTAPAAPATAPAAPATQPAGPAPESR